jgi:hypothetical protein
MLNFAQTLGYSNAVQTCNVITVRFFSFADKESKAHHNQIEYNQAGFLISEKGRGQEKNETFKQNRRYHLERLNSWAIPSGNCSSSNMKIGGSA